MVHQFAGKNGLNFSRVCYHRRRGGHFFTFIAGAKKYINHTNYYYSDIQCYFMNYSNHTFGINIRDSVKGLDLHPFLIGVLGIQVYYCYNCN